jgi:hypothetical protein
MPIDTATAGTLQPFYVSVSDALRVGGFKRGKLYELLGDGHITARKLGRRTLIDVRSLQIYLETLPTAQVGRNRRLAPL